MAFICGDCKKEHLVPTREEDRNGQPCVDAMARERDQLKAALAVVEDIVDHCCGCLHNSDRWNRYKAENSIT